MCDLFGMSCNSPDRATKSLPLFAEYSKEMYDGWGIAYYEGSEAKVIKNEDKAKKSDEFFPTVRRARSNVERRLVLLSVKETVTLSSISTSTKRGFLPITVMSGESPFIRGPEEIRIRSPFFFT
jgi:hypothetical protein